MGGLFLARESAPLEAAEAQFALSGFGALTPLSVPGWHGFHAAYARGGPATFMARGDDLVALAGTITVDGLMGEPALVALLDMGEPDWSRIGGHFAALVHRAGRTRLFTDYLAAFQLFYDRRSLVFSTSFLAAAQAVPTVTFDDQGVYEFAFNVVPIGEDTVLSELKTLGPTRIAEVDRAGARFTPIAKPLPDRAVDEPLADRIARHRAPLEAVVGAHVRQFGDAIHAPLSGGLDSRLLLAALRGAGATPHVYVYGPPGSDDVAVALAIGEAERFPVDWINKATRPLAPDAFPEQVEANFHAFDATPTFGNIFDNGGNLAARDARHAGGGLAASGGCGEIYRDFFFLPDRPMTAAALASTFFARFDAADAADRFDARAFLERIRDKIATALDVPATARIPRALIEQAYPRIRCRSLFGREISLEARQGAYLMPFLDHRVVAEAMTLPLPLKQAGRFEAQLLHAIDPALARHQSAYGHPFSGPPSRRHRFDEWSARARPPWLRRRSYAIKRRFGPLADEHGGLLGCDYMGRVIDLEFPIMRRWFEIERIADSGLWRRIACLEYLGERLGSRLAG